MFQSRTHTCNELRIGHVGQQVTLAGWYENMRRVSKNLGFLILRDFYGETQVVIESEDMMEMISGVNRESTLSVTGTVRERSSKNAALPTGDIEVVPEKIEVLGKCYYNALPFEISRSKEADENARLRYRYLDLRNPAVKDRILMRSRVVAELRQQDDGAGFLRDHHPHPHLLLAGGRAGLSGALQEPSRKILCPSSGAPAVQTASDGVRI